MTLISTLWRLDHEELRATMGRLSTIDIRCKHADPVLQMLRHRIAVQPDSRQAICQHRVGRAAQIDVVGRGCDVGLSSSTARQSAAGAGRGPNRSAQHSHQRSVSPLFRLDAARPAVRRDRGPPLMSECQERAPRPTAYVVRPPEGRRNTWGGPAFISHEHPRPLSGRGVREETSLLPPPLGEGWGWGHA